MSNNDSYYDSEDYSSFALSYENTDDYPEDEPCTACRGSGVVGWSHGVWDDDDCPVCYGEGVLSDLSELTASRWR
jgi:DnaJ-class molecular chaperone